MKSKLFLYLAIFVLSIFAGTALYYSRSHIDLSSAHELDWQALGEMDYITGNIPENLKKWDKKLVKIPGFMVPLEDNMKKVTQFLLVPTPQACIHVPAPPPNQMVLVEMKRGHEVDVQFGPIWIYGDFQIQNQRTMYGEVSYSLRGERIELYR